MIYSENAGDDHYQICVTLWGCVSNMFRMDHKYLISIYHNLRHKSSAKLYKIVDRIKAGSRWQSMSAKESNRCECPVVKIDISMSIVIIYGREIELNRILTLLTPFRSPRDATIM